MENRSIGVTRAYLHRGEAVSRSLWVQVSPRHPFLKLVMIPPLAGVMLTMFVLIALILGFTLLALVLLWTLSTSKQKESSRR